MLMRNGVTNGAMSHSKPMHDGEPIPIADGVNLVGIFPHPQWQYAL